MRLIQPFKVTVNGASKKLTFGPTGEISNAKYDIVNFDNDYFQQVKKQLIIRFQVKCLTVDSERSNSHFSGLFTKFVVKHVILFKKNIWCTRVISSRLKTVKTHDSTVPMHAPLVY